MEELLYMPELAINNEHIRCPTYCGTPVAHDVSQLFHNMWDRRCTYVQHLLRRHKNEETAS